MTRFISVREVASDLASVVRVAPRFLAGVMGSLGIVSLILTTACYTYEAQSPSTVPANQHVVVTLNNIGRVALTSEIGDNAETLEGDVVSASADGLRMRLTQASYQSGTSSTFGGAEVAVPRDGMTAVRTKQFSRTKTTAFVVAAIAAVVGAISAFGLGGIGGSGNDGKPVQPPTTQ